VFINDDMLVDTNMPSQCVLVENIPLNSSGKVDTKVLTSGKVTGKRFSVKPVKVNGELKDILLLPAAEGELATMGAGVPEELEGDPYTILSEIFAAIPDLQEGKISKFLKIPGLREMVEKLTGFDIGNIPASMRTMTPKMLDLALRKYLKPIMKGENTMSKKKGSFTGFMPMFQCGELPTPPMPPMPPMPAMPPMPFAPPFGNGNQKAAEDNTQKENFKSAMKSFLSQNVDIQKASVENNKKQWNQFFDYMMEMHETFAASIPEDTSSIPFAQMMPMSPKAFLKRVKEFNEMANAHFVEQADSFTDFCIQGQEQVNDMVTSAMDKTEEEVVEVVDEPVEEEKVVDEQNG
jgi:hypothetical protein